MRCEKVRLKIDAYVSGELPPRVIVAVEKHLRACDGCRQTAAVARRLVALGQALPIPPVPEGFAQRVQALARQRIARPTPAVSSWNLAAWWRLVLAPMNAAASDEEKLGSIEPGKQADLVVWNRDLRKIQAAKDLTGLEVAATYVGGKAVYTSPMFEDA